ncbi:MULTISPECIES: hypothetical protein [Bacillota]|uniref:hypothetical protein n=1 Tax=Bacillota TaxID=1239 RepID=UPI001C158DCA|nr:MULTISPECIES: hypothetical protein [Longicatena]EGT5163463.1 ABC transporter permease [Clostridioides difficile]MCQ5279928.1 ABC transporter permease [Clostridium sp. DFI.1.208]MBY2607621.1 ABC transporter permease [Clostridioides difficile]MCB6265752.1 hypothetical protein [Longicatena sp. 210702-DFI.1.160]MCB6316273.1 hypothetical protein [Longicatena sp. 210702-DFI.1.100]
MIELLKSILSNMTVFKIGMWYCLPLTIAVIVLFFVKSSRDERGRAIVGKASVISTILFIILINVYAQLSMYIIVDFITMACAIQWIYDIVLTVQVVAILIYKKIE